MKIKTAILQGLVLVALSSCGPARKPVPLGTVPLPPMVRAEDERDGQETLQELSRQYSLSMDDTQKDRVETVVARLAAASGANNETPWHITLFNAPEIKNAAATRGNFLFVWSGLLDYLRTDEELAVVLSHELGHILAGHVMPDPAEVASQAVAQIGGNIAGSMVGSAARVGIAGDLAGKLAEFALQAILVNPGQRRVETEADEVGLFLLAKAGYDPESAVNFWERVQNDPSFGSSTFAFLSSHPSGKDRYEHLALLLSDAELIKQKAWKIKTERAEVYENPSHTSSVITELRKGDYFFGNPESGGWICNLRECVSKMAATVAN